MNTGRSINKGRSRSRSDLDCSILVHFMTRRLPRFTVPLSIAAMVFTVAPVPAYAQAGRGEGFGIPPYLFLLGVLIVLVFLGRVIVRATSRRSLNIIEGEASRIRTDTSVQGSIRKGKGSITSTTVMNLLIDGKAAFAEFGEQINVNDGDLVCAAGDPQSNGLRVLAYHNISNGTHGEGGALARLTGYGICAIGAFGFLFALEFGGVLVAAIPTFLLGAWLVGIGHRYKAALKACLAQPAAQSGSSSS